MSSFKTITKSAESTKRFGKKLATTLKGGNIVCLRGDLGAGKTTLVKGIAEGLGIKEEITSPTFTLMNVYEIKKSRKQKNKKTITTLVHIDTYRLEDENDLLEIGVEDYLGQPGIVTIVEWPEKIIGLLKNKKVINIIIDHRKLVSERQITISNSPVSS